MPRMKRVKFINGTMTEFVNAFGDNPRKLSKGELDIKKQLEGLVRRQKRK